MCLVTQVVSEVMWKYGDEDKKHGDFAALGTTVCSRGPNWSYKWYKMELLFKVKYLLSEL